MTYKPARLKSRCLPWPFHFREALLIYLIQKHPEHGNSHCPQSDPKRREVFSPFVILE
jgi:hypothetical protein